MKSHTKTGLLDNNSLPIGEFSSQNLSIQTIIPSKTIDAGGEIKTFNDEKKYMELMTSKPDLQRIIEGKFGSEEEKNVQEVTGNK